MRDDTVSVPQTAVLDALIRRLASASEFIAVEYQMTSFFAEIEKHNSPKEEVGSEFGELLERLGLTPDLILYLHGYLDENLGIEHSIRDMNFMQMVLAKEILDDK